MIRDQEILNHFLDSIRRFVRERLVPAEEIVAETDAIPADIVARDEAAGAFRADDSRGVRRARPHDGRRGRSSMIELCQTSPAFRSIIGTTTASARRASSSTARRAEEEIPAETRERRADRVVRADRARKRVGRGVAPHQRAARRRPLRPERLQALHHQRAAGRHLHGDGAHQLRRRTRAASSAFIVERGHARAQRRQARPQDGPARRAHRDVIFDNARVPARTSSAATKARASRPR